MMITDENRCALKKLKVFLDRNNFSSCVSLALGEGTYYKNPLPDYRTFYNAIKKMPRFLQNFAKFFSLGLPITKNEFSLYFDCDTVEQFKLMGLCNYDETDIWLNNLLLVTYANCYVFVGNVYYYPTCQSKEQIPYIGPDSYWLSRMLNNYVHGTVLELCSGSGLQAIISAKTAKKVVAVDIDPQAISICRINVCLNCVDHIVDIRHGDLFDVIDINEKYNYIIANPPFIPIPENIPFPLAGDGGFLGDKITRSILEKCNSYLLEDGELLMIGQTVGNSMQPFLTKIIKERLRNEYINITYHSRTNIQHQAEETAKLANIINNKTSTSYEWMENYNTVGATHFYSFMLKARRSNKQEIIENFFNDTWLDSDIPQFKGTWKKTNDNYLVSCNGKQSVLVDDEIIEFIKRIDGISTIDKLLESMPIKHKIKYGEKSHIKMTAKYMSLCSFLEHNSILSKHTK